MGPFNLHGSLLPQYRGAAPINWALINGDTETGVTTFFLTHEIDTGKIIDQKHIPITETDNAGTVYDALMKVGAELVVETVDLLLAERVEGIDQEKFFKEISDLRPAPKIFKETCRINWEQPVKSIYDFVRGLSPYPAAWAELVDSAGKAQVIKVYQTEKLFELHTLPGGTIRSDKNRYIEVAGHIGVIRLTSVQVAGKKQVSVNEVLNAFMQIS